MRTYQQTHFSHVCDSRRWAIRLLIFFLFVRPFASVTAQEPVKIWEFSPYEVEVWYTFDPSINASKTAQQAWLAEVQADLERTFRAAWTVRMKPLTADLSRTVLRDFDGFTIDDLRAGELVLVVASEHSATQTLRTFEAAIEGLTEIACTADVKQQLETAVAAQPSSTDTVAAAPLSKLIDKCLVDAGGAASIEQKLKDASIAAALVPRWSLPRLAESTRPLMTPLPWQTDALFREIDKLFLLTISADGDDTHVQARELDCPMQYLGPAMSDRVANWSYASRLATTTIVRAFAPVARVEEAESRTAELRLRAGGLILDELNPAAVTTGDVMQPIVRRDDRNGIPTLLEPLAWTFAAITSSDGVKMQANVYTYSGGPGLQGRQNRRTQRMLLKVRPVTEQTDIELLVRGDGRPQGGCFVYSRDLVTDEYELLGRTDWRGRFTVRVPYEMGGLLPEAIRYERLLAKRAAEADAAKQAGEADAGARIDAASDAASDVANNAAKNEPNRTDAIAELDTFEPQGPDPAVIPLRAPLTQIYIKNGDTVLAKLPMVPGLMEIETAELPDDSRRLKAEAFVRGFQGEILDLIGLRNLLAARIKQHVKNGRIEAAKANVEELRQLRNYNQMADELEGIQRRMLDENAGPISIASKNQIDRMFQTTRDMLRKYMQDDLLSQSEQAISAK